MSDLSDIDISAVPLFPLPSVVLFPRAVLPLHIFEDRYRAMTTDALEGDRLIAMALLRPGWEKSYYGRPVIEPVVCVGRIVSHEKLADGKYNFLLEGLVRARIAQELPIGLPYRVAELTRIEQVPASENELEPLRARLVELFSKSRLAHTGVGKQFRQMFQTGWPTADICDLAAFTFLDDVWQKQSLLAEVDVRARVGRVVEALHQIAAAMPKHMSMGMPVDPSLN
jgi:uncharacterized protein